MKPISFKRHRFPADVIRQAVWLYFRFTLSIRDVEELLAQRGIEVLAALGKLAGAYVQVSRAVSGITIVTDNFERLTRGGCQLNPASSEKPLPRRNLGTRRL